MQTDYKYKILESQVAEQEGQGRQLGRVHGGPAGPRAGLVAG